MKDLLVFEADRVFRGFFVKKIAPVGVERDIEAQELRPCASAWVTQGMKIPSLLSPPLLFQSLLGVTGHASKHHCFSAETEIAFLQELKLYSLQKRC